MRITNRRQVDEPDASGELVDDVTCQLPGHACLTDAWRAGQREESNLGAHEPLAGDSQQLLAPDDRFGLERQVAARFE